MKQAILLLLFLMFSSVFLQGRAQDYNQTKIQTTPEVNVYPNPVQVNAYVEIDSEGYDFVRFELIDILGNKVKRWDKMELTPGKQRLKLNLQSLNSGFYLLKVEVKGQTVVKRIRKL